MAATITVAIPTYGRARLLDRQLGRVHAEVLRHPGRCRVVVSDNGSPDDTPDVVARWRERFEVGTFVAHRQPRNVGVMRNIAWCMTTSTTDYVWVLGDDDDVPDGTLGDILRLLDDDPGLALLSLNYAMVGRDGTLMTPARLQLDADVVKHGPGPLVERDRAGFALVLAMGFMSAQVYRSTDARDAALSWPEGYDNLEAMVYWSAFCAARGTTRVTSRAHVTYVCGTNALAHPEVWYRTHYLECPQTYLHLRAAGYRRGFCRRELAVVVRNRHELAQFAAGALRWPGVALRSLAFLASAMVLVHLPVRAVAAPAPARVSGARAPVPVPRSAEPR